MMETIVQLQATWVTLIVVAALVFLVWTESAHWKSRERIADETRYLKELEKQVSLDLKFLSHDMDQVKIRLTKLEESTKRIDALSLKVGLQK